MRHHHPFRIVADNDHSIDAKIPEKRDQGPVVSVPFGHQLPLPFEMEGSTRRIVVVSMNEVHGSTLRELISLYRPSAAVDLRQLIRFDLPGTSRKDVFKCFHHFHTHYVKDPLPWHELGIRDFIGRENPISQILIHEVAERDAGCVMVFVPGFEDARSISSHINRIMTTKADYPWTIEQVN